MLSSVCSFPFSYVHKFRTYVSKVRIGNWEIVSYFSAGVVLTELSGLFNILLELVI